MADGFEINVDDGDVRRILRAFDSLPENARSGLSQANRRIGELLAAATARAARSSDAQSALMARTVTARRDPALGVDVTGSRVEAGGTQRVGSKGTPAYKILFGSEFGSIRYRQFRRRRGSYWYFSTVDRHDDEALRQWAAAAESAARKWGSAS